jgi:hypothetical protein
MWKNEMRTNEHSVGWSCKTWEASGPKRPDTVKKQEEIFCFKCAGWKVFTQKPVWLFQEERQKKAYSEGREISWAAFGRTCTELMVWSHSSKWKDPDSRVIQEVGKTWFVKLPDKGEKRKARMVYRCLALEYKLRYRRERIDWETHRMWDVCKAPQ